MADSLECSASFEPLFGQKAICACHDQSKPSLFLKTRYKVSPLGS